MIKIFTIGFTESSAEAFFARLQKAGVKRVLDVRLNNVSQLAGFAKKNDLAYFLKVICGIDYSHRPELAPTEGMLEKYKRQKGQWADYEPEFLALMESRRVAETLPRGLAADACLLCSEKEPQHCHRRLVAEYLREKWGDVEIIHL